MRFFKHAILHRKNSVKINIFNFPKLKKNQLLVKIVYSGVCKSQLMEFEGLRGHDKWLPHGFGHEASGIVVDSNNSRRFKKNDKVICSWIRRKKNNYGFNLLNIDNQKINFGDITTFGNYSILSEDCIYKKPANLDMKEAALFGCAIPTGMGIVFNELNLKKNDKILLVGLGGVGFSSLIALKIKGFKKNTFIVEKNQTKIKLAKKFGFNKFININKVSELKNYRNFFDKCIETSGYSNILEKSFNLIKTSGHLVFASHPAENEFIKLKPHDLIQGKLITGSWGGSSDLDNDIPIYNYYIKQKKINLNLILGKIYKLKDLSTAFKDLKKNKVIRPLIRM